jgi:hypothetical protein
MGKTERFAETVFRRCFVSEREGKYEVTVTVTGAEIEAARIEREHAMRQGHCVCVVCEDQRMLRVERDVERLRRIEQAARDVIASGENTCGEGRTLADLDKFRLAMEALRSALDSP